MDRMQVIARKPKRTLAVLVAVLVAVGVAIGSGAAFTAQSANPSNAFSAGTLTMSNSKDSAAILTVGTSNIKPGDVSTGTVDIENTGSLGGAFVLSRSALSDSDAGNPLSGKLNLVVKDCGDFSSGTPTCDAGDPNKYSGTLNAMTSNVALGTFAPSEKHRYEFTSTFDVGAGNVYQGDTSSATFTWDAS